MAQLSEAEHRALLRLAGSGGGAMGIMQQQHRTDFDVLKEHFRFAWREGEEDESSCACMRVCTWMDRPTGRPTRVPLPSTLTYAGGARMAKRYVSKLFKEYALADLSRYKQGQVGLRWRVEREVIEGKASLKTGLFPVLYFGWNVVVVLHQLYTTQHKPGPIHLRQPRLRRPRGAWLLGAALHLPRGGPGQDGAGQGPPLWSLQAAAGPGQAGAWGRWSKWWQ